MQKVQHYIQGQWIDGQGEGNPIFDSVTGEHFTNVTTEGIDVPEVLQYGRTKGDTLRKMTFIERGNMLKKLAFHLQKHKRTFYDISFKTGATKIDSWVDIEGGFGNLFANASLRKLFPNQPYHVEGEPIDLSRGGRFMAHHIMVPKTGVAVHINAFNFPVWGMLEKCAVNWMAGVPAVVLPAPQSAYLTEAVVKVIIESGILPEGALQLISGTRKDILDTVESQDIVTFTGSASTGRKLKTHPRLIEESVPFTMEADSLNASILGEDAKPGTPEFDLFIKEVRNEMTSKCGQKCTAIRRIIVPQNLMEDVQIALGKALDKVTYGDPRLKEVRMGTLIDKKQVEAVKNSVQEIAKTAEIVYGDFENGKAVGADFEKGAFIKPILLRENDPFTNHAAHITEAFGPVSTLMPYKSLDQAVELSRMGRGSLVSSIATNDDKIAKDYTIRAATHHGRILVLNRESAKQSTGHGSPLPNLIHGGPGRAGGGEEMGGVRGIKHYLQRCAVQGSPTTLTEITGIYQPNADYKEAEKHPFAYHWEDIEAGMSLKTHSRTLTDTDIINFGNLTWDHFYAHTDITSLEGSIFEQRTAHGYFIISAAAGLFVYPNKGPVAANYGLEEIRFLRPLYHNDTIHVRLTCKQKIDRDQKGKELPSGIVKWYVEVFDTDVTKGNIPESEKEEKEALVAIATILTMVQKKQTTFKEITDQVFENALHKLTEDTKPEWGIMTPQHMVEHLEASYRIASGEIQDFEISTPKKYLDDVKETLYNYEPMPKNYNFPFYKEGELFSLKHEDLAMAKQKLKEAKKQYENFFVENSEAVTKNAVFGELTKFEWKLLHRKHLNHHFKQFGIL
ncbi:phenylacetic acid degradation bifunctional protein PaaZ [Mesonia maritima]|uniref:Oxepin-CoA hydrolase/3-oxo-5,6-dehydrosuberyl-CoA semialdehyde dehydrogenase n=1 Tax=Mesonia maritima TaxID=1793873 RepID=A0ABU1K8B9_9FLAO|nr:phenylacetic acid degradation bifunctional protein PaaZ [Mesonia maritima]MDR6301865.1 oxepin-CoA hydrolase/3-oxo-5,6-dehydrosuberyl-CoA semialdehyde dehydrogenase [Mesonia maritima]